jgi:Protease subunit of ATP-dependent Clp proteases
MAGIGLSMRAREDPDPRQPGPDPGRPFPSAPWLDERMFEHRMVLVRGRIDAALANHVAGVLLVLGRSGSEPVHMHLSAPDGELSAAFAIADAIEVAGVAVHAVVTSEVGGAALAVLAAAHRRTALAHARIRLAEPRVDPLSGTADEVTAAAGRYLRDLDELIVRLAEVTGQPRNRIEDDLSAGRILSATEAVEYGLIDEIAGRDTPRG